MNILFTGLTCLLKIVLTGESTREKAER